MRDDVTYRNVTGDTLRCAGDVFEDGAWWRPDDAARSTDALRAAFKETDARMRELFAQRFAKLMNGEAE